MNIQHPARAPEVDAQHPWSAKLLFRFVLRGVYPIVVVVVIVIGDTMQFGHEQLVEIKK